MTIPLEVDLNIEIDEDVDLDVEAVAEAGGLPPVSVADDGKIAQVKNGIWNVQHPELGEETIHFLTNFEIEALFNGN